MQSTEKELIDKLIKNDEAAFAGLINIYSERLFRAALFFTGNKEDAEDAVQETFIAVHKYIKTFRFESSLYTWMNHILANSCKKVLRNKYRWYDLTAKINAENVSLQKELVESWKDKNENLYLAAKAMESLDLVHKKTVYYAYIDGLKQEEIAVIMKCPVGTIHSRLSVAKKKMKEYIMNVEQSLYIEP